MEILNVGAPEDIDQLRECDQVVQYYNLFDEEVGLVAFADELVQ